MINADVILLKYGEIALKGLNRPMFERSLLDNIKRRLKKIGQFKVSKAQSTVYVEPLESVDMEETVTELKKVFGVVNICPALRCPKTQEDIWNAAVRCVEEHRTGEKTFKVEARREDKNFPMNSPQICRELGGHLLSRFPDLKVDVHRPELMVQVEIRGEAYVYCKRERGAGGMPVGTNGRAALLLSGGIDSPVAGYMIAKRGVEIQGVHFHSHPYTSDRAKEKVIELAELMSEYCDKIKLHIVPFTEIQLAIIEKCPKNLLTIIMRRIMMRIAQRIAEQEGAQALITGESIGQVASQTIESLATTDAAVSTPVFRPVIGMDKEEIVTISKQIGTYETSILPYEDCCTIFVPKHPKTKPTLAEVEEAETALIDLEDMIERSLAECEVVITGEQNEADYEID